MYSQASRPASVHSEMPSTPMACIQTAEINRKYLCYYSSAWIHLQPFKGFTVEVICFPEHPFMTTDWRYTKAVR